MESSLSRLAPDPRRGASRTRAGGGQKNDPKKGLNIRKLGTFASLKKKKVSGFG